LTVRETLLFSANLRLPESATRAVKQSIVDMTLQELGISHIANSRIGGNGAGGISGGEKRRVSIGIELVTSPSILLLDEPTSGLDSFNALMLIQVGSRFLILRHCRTWHTRTTRRSSLPFTSLAQICLSFSMM
jgi:ABC-type multidrug transport system ATPase subunit